MQIEIQIEIETKNNQIIYHTYTYIYVCVCVIIYVSNFTHRTPPASARYQKDAIQDRCPGAAIATRHQLHSVGQDATGGRQNAGHRTIGTIGILGIRVLRRLFETTMEVGPSNTENFKGRFCWLRNPFGDIWGFLDFGSNPIGNLSCEEKIQGKHVGCLRGKFIQFM